MPAGNAGPVTKQFRDFSGGTQRTAARSAMKDNELYWNENAQPIGPGEIQILPPPGDPICTITEGIEKMFGVDIKISGTEAHRLITINTDGSLTAVDPQTGSTTVVGPSGTVTSAARVKMWNDTPLLIGDPTKGYLSWDGTTLNKYPITLTGTTATTSAVVTGIAPNTVGLAAGMKISGTGIPAGDTILSVDSSTQIHLATALAGSGTAGVTLSVGAGAPTKVYDLAQFEGRAALLTDSRSITLTAPASFTDFATADGATTASIADSVFSGSITSLLSALELLWIIGPSAVNAISNIQLTGSTTTYSNTNIVASVGTLLPSSVTSFFRTFIFLAPYGVYAIVGATPQKLSDNLDGLFPYLTFTDDTPAAVFTVNNVFVWGVLVTYNDPVAGARPLLLCFARNAWFEASQGDDLKWITSCAYTQTGVGQIPALFGTDGTTIYRCFAGTVPGPYTIQTKLWDFGAFTTAKELLKVAVEFNTTTAVAIDQVITAENANGMAPAPIDLTSSRNGLTWLGLGGSLFTWLGADGLPFVWLRSGLQRSQGPGNLSGGVLGLTIAGTSLPYAVTGLALEIHPQGDWTA